jgi:hypothetical protein
MEEKKKENEGGVELVEVMSEMGEEELIRIRHRLRKAGKESGRVVEEEIRKREGEAEELFRKARTERLDSEEAGPGSVQDCADRSGPYSNPID